MYTAGISIIQKVVCKKGDSAYLYIWIWNL